MKDHPLWPEFVKWANDNGVDPNGEEIDWKPWWDSFFAGARACAKEYGDEDYQ